MGIGNVLYGVDADIKIAGSDANHKEHLRRLSEVANILLDAGHLLIVTATDLNCDDMEIIRTTVNPDRIMTVWVGDHVTTDCSIDLRIPGKDSEETVDENVDMIKIQLQERGIIFNPTRF